MKVTMSWLREFTPVQGSPIEVGEELSELGLALEELTTFSLGGIVVARVLETRPHPAADRIQLVDVDAGDGEALQVACGAFNFAAGDLVPLATVGTVMPNGMEIGRRKMRGEWSNGMLCSAAEIGLGTDHSGIMILDDDLEVGVDFDRALGLVDEALLDLEVNPNRPDAMSVFGVARDLAARRGLPLRWPDPVAPEGSVAVSDSAGVEIEDPVLCGRFVARVLRGAGPVRTPSWMRTRLALCGMRPISPVVDVSNYVMLELGVPNHAYDLARVPDGRLRVRRARAGETLVTLDGVERVLDPGDGLICDGTDRPIGLAGVMGGLDTEIGESTTEVLLEAAWWDPPSISRTSRRHGLRSEASARFERGADPEMLERAVDRFVELLGVSADAGTIDERGELPWPRRVSVRTERVNAVLGTELSAGEIVDQLEPLGFACERGGDVLAVEIPSWRHDSETEIDVIEEVARLYGYSRLGRRVPRSPYPGGLSDYQLSRHRVRDTLAGLGLSEAMPLPLLAPDAHERAGLGDHRPVSLLNPLTSEESTLRTSLLPGLLGAVGHNAAHRQPGVRLFEIGSVVQRAADPSAELPDEHENVGAIMAGADAPEAVRVVRALLGAVGAEGVRLVNSGSLPGMHPTRGARVTVAGTEVGVVGEIHPEVATAHEVAERLGWFELRLDTLLEVCDQRRMARSVSWFPSADIDLAFETPDAVSAEEVAATLEACSELVTSVELFDVYRGAQVTPGHRSLAFALRLQADDRTLSDADIASVRDQAIAAVGSRHESRLRA